MTLIDVPRICSIHYSSVQDVFIWPGAKPNAAFPALIRAFPAILCALGFYGECPGCLFVYKTTA